MSEHRATISWQRGGLAHENCFIANSIKTQVHIEAQTA